MSLKFIDIYNILDETAPFIDAEENDNSGLLVGDLSNSVTKVCVALDATVPVIEEAAEKGAQLIVSHHPIIYTPITELGYREPAFFAAYRGIGVISAHTNFDMHVLPELMLEKLGITPDIEIDDDFILSESGAGILHPVGTDDCTDGVCTGYGYGRVADLKKPITANSLAGRIKSAFGAPFIRGLALKKEFKRIAAVSGAASSEVTYALNRGADVLIAGELKHSAYVEAENQVNGQLSLFEAGHFYTENLFCDYVRDLIEKNCPDTEVFIADQNVNPFVIV